MLDKHLKQYFFFPLVSSVRCITKPVFNRLTYRSEAQSQEHGFFSCAGSGRANWGTQVPWVDGLGCLFKSWKSLWRTGEHASPGSTLGGLGAAAGDVMAVQTAGINPPKRFPCADSQASTPGGPTEYLSSVAGPTLWVHLHLLCLGYQANLMPFQRSHRGPCQWQF